MGILSQRRISPRLKSLRLNQELRTSPQLGFPTLVSVRSVLLPTIRFTMSPHLRLRRFTLPVIPICPCTCWETDSRYTVKLRIHATPQVPAQLTGLSDRLRREFLRERPVRHLGPSSRTQAAAQAYRLFMFVRLLMGSGQQ